MIKTSKSSEYEDLLLMCINADEVIPEPVLQFKAIPGRKFAWDFAWPDHKVLLEVQGGTWSHNRTAHSTGAGIRRDCIKGCLAVIYGYRNLQVTSDMVTDGTALAILRSIFSDEKEELDACVFILKSSR
jgi:hypothetical protein